MLKVYNTMTRQKEEFHPLKPGEVSIYCCGVTPYNAPHIGNARPFVTWDVIRRYFASKGLTVHYIQNFTDVDDKIIRTANSEHTTWKDVADRNIAIYFHSMDALGVRRAEKYPRVSETMADIIAMVQKLIDKGYAYALENGDVFYSVEKFQGYGKLSGRKLSDMQAGARIEVDERKHHPMDFALWKSAKPGEPSWDSPWGKGRPGWHIECSTMSLKYLGEKFDFHGGGSDLIFPHHENEIAQSQACIGDDHSFAQYWLHNGFITIHNEKMSKSKNNFFTVEDILKEYPGEVVRFFILQTHYRSPLDFSDDRLKEAQTSLSRLQTTQGYIEELAKKQGAGEATAAELAKKAEELRAAFDEAMDDDFNTALAISQLFALSKEINIYYQDVTAGKAFDAENFAKVKNVWDAMAGIIGLFEQQEEAADDGLTEKLMELIISIRQDARKNKNWAIADKIRDELKEIGIVLEDTKNGVRWKKA
ncbi:MAG: cysteine--tRNA ligase [Veillonellaceae bacterium]|jgi:cysteinyl-tRNA synthetase|uniref:cysteine--tRNA ligase n=1 Tax=uncultured Selenomonas sp. TaxID=159275 RepID=UPI0025F9A28E|nr:cysteine--tRNA ligase [uncultured Selenomonas sp.]MCI7539484.1 cysteine--tRNA ligase [Veillonellaceae bacterium]MDD6127891.1 cysteine--tRNA ligase [Veillonellaceae bacterium]MDD6697644.1 cysteine--tRNA ligase [Veillonellaceae bacterium]MDY6350631.1 cysteine--tRNA ligase [Selenomonas sp.]